MNMKKYLLFLVFALAMALPSGVFAQDGVSDSLSIDDQEPVLYQEQEEEPEQKSTNTGVYVAIAIVVGVGIYVGMKSKKKK